MDELNEMYPFRRQQNLREKKGSGSKQVESEEQTRQRRKKKQVDANQGAYGWVGGFLWLC